MQISHKGENFNARAFLDQGSEKTFISKSLQQRLMLPTEAKSFQIRGIGGHIVGNSNSLCTLTLYSKKYNRYVDIQAIVVPKISRMLPSFSISKSEISHNGLEELELADPQFQVSSQVHLLIGSNFIPNILLNGVKNVCNSLIAQSTIFGWVISGPIKVPSASSFSIQTTEVQDDSLTDQLKLFWSIEEVPNNSPLSEEDALCESLFERTTYRIQKAVML